MGACDKTKKATDTPQWHDPLGPTDSTGAHTQRSRIFDYLSSTAPQTATDATAFADRSRVAANDPGFAEAQALARRTMAGEFLNGSPQLDAALAGVRSRANAETADTATRIRGGFARNGMQFSTANQQAQQSNQAATTARSNEVEASARLQNYLSERALQAAAPGALAAAHSAPLNYLSGISSAGLDPLSKQAAIVAALAGGGQIATPSTAVYKDSGLVNQAFQAIGNL